MAATDYQANITQGSISVDILMAETEWNFDKQLQEIHIPKQDPPLTWLIDLKKLKETQIVRGWLLDEDVESALTKKNNLRAILQTAGTMVLTWGTGAKVQQFTVNILKGFIKEKPGRVGDEGTIEKIFEVFIQFEFGTHKG